MNDRELLELAAKAAGIPVTPDCHIPSGGLWLFNVDVDRVWNPLADDGDALRLAATLKLTVDFERGVVWGAGHLDDTCLGRVEDDEPSMRRAIVRAAAEIGRTK